MLIRPFDQPMEGHSAQKDQDLGFYRVRMHMKKSKPRLVSIYLVIRGALLIEDFDFNLEDENVKEYLVVDVVDADMFSKDAVSTLRRKINHSMMLLAGE